MLINQFFWREFDRVKRDFEDDESAYKSVAEDLFRNHKDIIKDTGDHIGELLYSENSDYTFSPSQGFGEAFSNIKDYRDWVLENFKIPNVVKKLNEKNKWILGWLRKNPREMNPPDLRKAISIYENAINDVLSSFKDLLFDSDMQSFGIYYR
jgi:hypothetical protein